MSYNPARDVVDGLLNLGALNVQIGVLMAEAELGASGSTKTLPAVFVPDPPPSHGQIEATALAIEQEILGNYELGFQAMLRLNSPGSNSRNRSEIAERGARRNDDG